MKEKDATNSYRTKQRSLRQREEIIERRNGHREAEPWQYKREERFPSRKKKTIKSLHPASSWARTHNAVDRHGESG